MSTLEENTTQETQKGHVRSDEIDILALLIKLWAKRKFILKIIASFFLVGIFIAIFSLPEYTSTTSMIPQSSESKVGGNLSGLASLAGINLGGSAGEEIPPELYPKIVESTPFKKEVLDSKITLESISKEITLREYFEKHEPIGLIGYLKKYTIGLPGLLLSSFKKSKDTEVKEPNSTREVFRISRNEKKYFNRLTQIININVDVKNGMVTISATIGDPVIAAQVTEYTRNILQQHIIQFKVQKSKEQLIFVEERFKEKRKEFEATQQRLASYQDSNQYLSSAQAQTVYEKLQSEYELIFGVYSELAKQLETKKIQVEEDTPVFTVIEKAFVPLEKSKPKRSLILVIYTFLGLVIGVGIVLLKDTFLSIKEKLRESTE